MKRIFGLLLLVVFTVGLIIYILPDFTVKVFGRDLTFNALPDLTQENLATLNFNIPQITYTFKYEIRSTISLKELSKEDINKIIIEDQNILEERIKIYLERDAFDIQSYYDNDNIYYSIFSNIQIQNPREILTLTNGDFAVTKFDFNFSAIDESGSPTTSESVVNIGRSDFGSAEIKELEGTDLSPSSYLVRLPIGLLNTTERDEIRAAINSSLTTKLGGQQFTSQFQTSTDGRNPLALVVLQTDNINEARLAQALLNTDFFNLGYEILGEESIDNINSRKIGFIVLILFFGITLLVLAGFKKTLTFKKLIILIISTLCFLALIKAFGLAISLITLLLLMCLLGLSLLSLNDTLYVVIFSLIIILKLFGVEEIVDIKWLELLLLMITSIVYWLIRNERKQEKKYS